MLRQFSCLSHKFKLENQQKKNSLSSLGSPQYAVVSGNLKFFCASRKLLIAVLKRKKRFIGDLWGCMLRKIHVYDNTLLHEAIRK